VPERSPSPRSCSGRYGRLDALHMQPATGRHLRTSHTSLLALPFNLVQPATPRPGVGRRIGPMETRARGAAGAKPPLVVLRSQDASASPSAAEDLRTGHPIVNDHRIEPVTGIWAEGAQSAGIATEVLGEALGARPVSNNMLMIFGLPEFGHRDASRAGGVPACGVTASVSATKLAQRSSVVG